MNAKELLKEYPDTTAYFECSDAECFLTEEEAKAHADHFVRTYEKVEVEAVQAPAQAKDFIDEVIDRIKERIESEDAARKAPEPEPEKDDDSDPVGDPNPLVGPIGVTGEPGVPGVDGQPTEPDSGKKGKAKNEDKKA